MSTNQKLDDEFVGRVPLPHGRPGGQLLGDLTLQAGLLSGQDAANVVSVGTRLGQECRGCAQVLHTARDGSLIGGDGVVVADGLRDLGEVARPGRGHQRGQGRGLLAVRSRENAGSGGEPALREQVEEEVVQVRDAIVGEPGRRRAEDRHVLP